MRLVNKEIHALLNISVQPVENPHQRDHTNDLNTNNGKDDEDSIPVAGDLSSGSVILASPSYVRSIYEVFRIQRFLSKITN